MLKHLAASIAGLMVGVCDPVFAQITPDATLGSEASRVTPNVTVRGAAADRIEGGATRGGNLFHSFSEFNVNAGQRVYFANPDGIRNILGRVTGNDVSDVLGTLGVDGNANLFLLNPNGIIFGRNASLDVQGSFIGTTANGFQFGDQGVFSATNPEATALLTIDPSALLFTQVGNGAIANQSRNLTVPGSGSLLLVGGDVNFDGGVTGALAGGQVGLGGLSEPGSVGLVPSSGGWQLSFPTGVGRSDVSLRNQSVLISLGATGGSVSIDADDIQVSSNSQIAALLSQGGVNVQGGTVRIDAIGTLTISDSSSISNAVLGDGVGGNTNISAQNINLVNGALISSVLAGEGRSGNITIRARDTISLRGRGTPTSEAPNGSPSVIQSGSIGKDQDGISGNISLQARRLTLTDGALVSASNFSTGNAGDIEITVSDSFQAEGDSGGLQAVTRGQGNGGNIAVHAGNIVMLSGAKVKTQASAEGLGGNAGNIAIDTNLMTMTNRTQIVSTTAGTGTAGNITITVGDRLNSTDSQVISQVNPTAIGNGGTIRITAGSLNLLQGSQLIADTFGQGDAGDIRIRVRDRMVVRTSEGSQRSSIISSSVGGTLVNENGSEEVLDGESIRGNGGTIDMKVGSLRLDNAQLQSDTRGVGNSGNIRINARDRISVNDSSIFTSVGSSGSGQGGTVQIVSGSVFFTNRGQIASGTQGQGNAGNIIIRTRNNSRDRIVVDGANTQNADILTGLRSSVDSTGIGRGGAIRLNTGSLILRDQGQIFSGTEGQGRAGNIQIRARDRLVTEGFTGNALIPALTGISLDLRPTGVGRGGNLNITTDFLSLSNGAQFRARTNGQGNAGNIHITANDVQLVGSDRNGIASNISVASSQDAMGRPGRLTVNAGSLQIRDGAFISAQTQNNRRGGNIRINIDTLAAIDGGQIITTTAGEGRAGTVRLNTRENLLLSGSDPNFNRRRERLRQYAERTPEDDQVSNLLSNQGAASGIYASTGQNSSGEGGNILANTQRLTVQDGAQISVGSRGTGEGGQINLRSESTLLDRGQITSNTNQSNSGNINIQSDALTLRNRSHISTNAGTADAPGNGGNININARTIVAIPTENSDITANAFSGNGGAVNITTEGIIGLDATPTNTSASNITASSDQGVQGVVTLNTPDIDPTQGLVELPSIVTDASNQIDQTCSRVRRNSTNEQRSLSEFVVSGRGGLPPSPFDPLVGSEATGQLATLDDETASSESNVTEPSSTAIVEAQGWAIAPSGKVMLVAMTPDPTLRSLIVPHANCHPQ